MQNLSQVYTKAEVTILSNGFCYLRKLYSPSPVFNDYKLYP